MQQHTSSQHSTASIDRPSPLRDGPLSPRYRQHTVPPAGYGQPLLPRLTRESCAKRSATLERGATGSINVVRQPHPIHHTHTHCTLDKNVSASLSSLDQYLLVYYVPLASFDSLLSLSSSTLVLRSSTRLFCPSSSQTARHLSSHSQPRIQHSPASLRYSLCTRSPALHCMLIRAAVSHSFRLLRPRVACFLVCLLLPSAHR
jgi:hypothetical protein